MSLATRVAMLALACGGLQACGSIFGSGSPIAPPPPPPPPMELPPPPPGSTGSGPRAGMSGGESGWVPSGGSSGSLDPGGGSGPKPAPSRAAQHGRPIRHDLGTRAILPVPAVDPGTARYCEIVQQAVTAAECDWLTHAEERLAKGVAAFAPPREMMRGETRTVRFSIAAGTDQAAADEALAVSDQDGPIIRMKNARFGRYIEARLSGEGFAIDPPGRVLKDLYAAREAVWEWNVTALRNPLHRLRIEAWVRRELPDHSLGDVSYRAISPVTVNVPIRFYPDRIDDFMADSMAWFGKGANWLKALGVFLGAASAAWLALRGFGKKAQPKPA